MQSRNFFSDSHVGIDGAFVGLDVLATHFLLCQAQLSTRNVALQSRNVFSDSHVGIDGIFVGLDVLATHFLLCQAQLSTPNIALQSRNFFSDSHVGIDGAFVGLDVLATHFLLCQAQFITSKIALQSRYFFSDSHLGIDGTFVGACDGNAAGAKVGAAFGTVGVLVGSANGMSMRSPNRVMTSNTLLLLASQFFQLHICCKSSLALSASLGCWKM